MITRLLFIFLIITESALAQSTIISSFNGSQLNQTVYLAFTISAGQTCNGIEIQRSTDSVQFYKIGDIAGICGSVSTPVNYSYADSFPVHNTVNFYRIAPGNADWSTIIKVFFRSTGEKDFVVSPNPFHTTASISFKNPLRKVIEWKLVDATGKQVNNGTTKDESFTVDRKNLSAGLYFLNIIFDNKDFEKAKLIVE